MQDQLSNQSQDQLAGQSIPPLQRITYRDSNRGIRQDETNPTITEAATDMEQHYQPLERLHNVGLHGWGVAAGLQVAFTPHQVGVTVRPGIALDSNGLHILLVAGGQADISLQSDGPGTQPPVPVNNNGVLVPTTGLTGDQFLVIRFFEVVDNAHFCTHTPWVHFVTLADLPTDGSSIILARITFDSGSNAGQVLTVLQGARQRTDGHVERAYDFNIQRPAVLAGLAVSATLNSAGITVFPGLALNAFGQYISLNSGGQAEIGPNADAPGATPTLVDVSDSGVLLPTTGFTGQKYLMIQSWETPKALTLPTPANTLQTAPVRFLYTPRLQLVDTSNFTFDGASVILAGITFGSGGVVTSLNADARPNSALSTGSFHVLKNIATPPSENSLSVLTGEAGAIVPMSNGLALTVSNAEDEIHLNAANVQTSGWLTVGGGITAGGDMAVENGLVNGGLSVGGVTAVHGDLNTAGTLNVTSAANVQGDMNVGGELMVMGPTTANGDVAASGSLTVTGPITANGGLTTTRNISATQLSADLAIHVGGTPFFNGSIDIHQANNPLPAIQLTTTNTGGSITVNGPVIKSGGGFRIPHPLNPKHKTLTHSFVESPDMKNLYDGIVILDTKGEATIEMPAWFTALNSDIRYQLTCIGGYAPVYIAQEMEDNSFTIAGGLPEMKVSWQVTGIRQDTWARENRFKVEEDKQPDR